MSKETFIIESCSETLQVTSRGKFELNIEGVAHFIKQLTPKQAKDWFEKRYPKNSWEEVVKEVNEWHAKRVTKPPLKQALNTLNRGRRGPGAG